MQSAGGADVQATLQQIDVHASWASGYRTPENEPFYELAFDFIASVFGAPGSDAVLDAGCGASTKSVHLARRGYRVVAVDFSERILEIARETTAAAGLRHLIEHRVADLTTMPFPDGFFGRVLCWGVLMHVPAVERAVSELVRITRPGGTIIVSEGNMHSVDALGMRAVKRLLRRGRARVHRTRTGLEFWEEHPSGTLMTRQADVPALARAFEASGAALVERRAGQFSELFASVPWKPVRRGIHAFNSLWFRRIGLPGPARGNLLIFRKGG